MKNLITMGFLLALSSLSSASERTACHGSYSAFGGYVSGHCTSGRCSGYVNSSSRYLNGNCANNAVVHATAYAPSEYLSGNCSSGRFSTYTQSVTIKWTGTCSGGGRFTGTSNEHGGYLSGSCSANGSFSAYAPSEYSQVSGVCEFL